MKELEEWFKLKRYPHIGLPITIKDYNRVKNYVSNPTTIAKHSFFPLINKSILKRRFRSNNLIKVRNPSGKWERIADNPKVRETYFASHLDALIFSKYNSLLTEAYENYIKDEPFNDAVVAYRKIPVEIGKEGNKCNIDFAKTAFEFIKANNDKKLTVIVADITSFFDNLDHKILKRKWIEVLNGKQNPRLITLPSDHYNLFKGLTKIRYVIAQQLFEHYGKTMIVRRGIINSSTEKEYFRKSIPDLRFAKEKNAVAYCNEKEFIANNLNLIISKKNNAGIPQGSPISATLANIYMLDFDKEISKEVDEISGFYQRYSDDLIIVCDMEHEDEIINVLNRVVASNKVKLTIEPKKTKVYRFEDLDGKFTGYAVDHETKEPAFGKPLEYLGFSFDGRRALIKNTGFSKFYRSMKGAINRGADYAKHSKNPDNNLFKTRLYKRFTYKGAGRKVVYRPSKKDKNVYEASKTYYWGNYLSYVYKTNDTLKELNGDNSIKNQSRRFWYKFNFLLKQSELKIKK
ncbi:reverse transcriptase domain-containing protein [Pedobacter namyangjuensis]|uniref:reverse transcriptase domain-containing protein n=1 Tax=Pedobacter namyangjuensis TaxID=600626 RepID=UPI000DE1D4B7|nr:reverse transcriptase domain-containing protein [Pedobacter namyangjuensis]